MPEGSLFRRSRPKRINPALLIIGVGLLLVGVAALFVLPRSQQNGSVQTGLSVVPVPVNYPAPELTLSDLKGNAHSLTDYRGQVVLVNLWATWCPPCKAEMPELQAFFDKYAAQGFVVIGIEDGESPNEVADFVGNYGLTFPVWTDSKYQTEKAFKTMNLPSSYVIDRRGAVQLAWTGGITLDMLEKYVAPIIDQ